MNLESLDWAALERLRAAFLSGAAGKGAYWTRLSDLASYDATFAERIGWKWDAVLAELTQAGWAPPAGRVYDFGCGSGIAGRRVLRTWGGDRLFSLRVSDRSPLAEEFSMNAARTEFPGVEVGRFDPAVPPDPGSGATLVISHVLNELPAAARTTLAAWIRHFDVVLWVEPGSRGDGQALIEFRESLRSTFQVVAPCPHQAACGLTAPGREADWCHFFAAPPPGIFADGNWVRFGQRMGIDLRGLPYSYLVLDRRVVHGDGAHGRPQPGETGESEAMEARLLGTPRMYKGFAKLFLCHAHGTGEVTFQKRTDPALFKRLERDRTGTRFQVRLEGEQVKSLTELPGNPDKPADEAPGALVP
jgi:SAM-dependent methyltransferase